MDAARNFLMWSGIFFVFYLLFYSTIMIFGNFIGSIDMFQSRKQEKMRNQIEHDFYVPVSILVPAYNEEVTILDMIEQLLHLDYKIYEIVIIDDGSKDKTAQLVIDKYKLEEQKMPIHYKVPCKPIHSIWQSQAGKVPITLIQKENGGCKADASNAGINVCRYPYFVDMDADEVLQKDALKYAAQAILEDENVIGVGGNIRVSNGMRFHEGMPVPTPLPRNPIVLMQNLEYGRSFIGSRIFQDKYNGNLIISGGYGLFKKEAVVKVGGYDADSLGEDMELTMRLHAFYKLHKIPYVMRYIPNAVCWTQGCETFSDLKRQRTRWHCGLFQAMMKHRILFFNHEFGAVSLLSYTWFLLYELLAPLIELFGYIVILVAWVTGLLAVRHAIYFSLMYAAFCAFLTLLTFLDRIFMKNEKLFAGDLWKVCLNCILEPLVFRPYLLYVRLTAFFGYKKNLGSWESPNRRKLV